VLLIYVQLFEFVRICSTKRVTALAKAQQRRLRPIQTNIEARDTSVIQRLPLHMLDLIQSIYKTQVAKSKLHTPTVTYQTEWCWASKQQVRVCV
jgi:hypothetical protein